MKNGEEMGSYGPCEPNSPRPRGPVAYYGQNKDTLESVMHQRDTDGLMWQKREEERLGKVLVKAWDGGYEGADDVVKHVTAIAETTDVNVIEDEIDIGTA